MNTFNQLFARVVSRNPELLGLPLIDLSDKYTAREGDAGRLFLAQRLLDSRERFVNLSCGLGRVITDRSDSNDPIPEYDNPGDAIFTRRYYELDGGKRVESIDLIPQSFLVKAVSLDGYDVTLAHFNITHRQCYGDDGLQVRYSFFYTRGNSDMPVKDTEVKYVSDAIIMSKGYTYLSSENNPSRLTMREMDNVTLSVNHMPGKSELTVNLLSKVEVIQWLFIGGGEVQMYQPTPKDVTMNQKRVRNGKKPLAEITTVKLLSPIVKRAPASESKGGTHASPRMHERRGHLRRYASGKTIWVKKVLVGKKENGYVKHVYTP